MLTEYHARASNSYSKAVYECRGTVTDRSDILHTQLASRKGLGERKEQTFNKFPTSFCLSLQRKYCMTSNLRRAFLHVFL
jgi:hypothetical protein